MIEEEKKEEKPTKQETSEEQDFFNEPITNPHLEKFDYFLNLKYSKEIDKLNDKDKILRIDFKSLEEYDPYLADELVKNPDKCIDAIKYCINKKITLFAENKDLEPTISIYNLPQEHKIFIKHINAEDIDCLIGVEGIVRQFTTILPKLKVAHWLCKRCGYEFNIDVKHEIETPTACPECRHKFLSLIENKSVFIDYQKLEIQEPLEVLKGGEQSSTLVVSVTDSLVGKVGAGDRIIVTGVMRLVPPQKKQSVYGRYLECFDIEETKQDYEDIEIDEENLEQIRAYSENPEIYDILVNSIAPNIFGHDIIKESIALQLFGGVKKTMEDGSKTRGNIHILLIGDPGVGKSKLLLYASNVAPKSLYVVGKTASGAGLCVGKDTYIFENKELHKIKNIIENKPETLVKNNGIYSAKGTGTKTITLNIKTKKAEEKEIREYHKIPAKELVKILDQYGQELITTKNTPLLVSKNKKIQYVRASNLKKDDLLVGLRTLAYKGHRFSLLDLLDLKNSKIRLTTKKAREIDQKIKSKFGTKRIFAKKYNFDENTVYYNLNHRGVPYNKLEKLLNLLNLSLKEKDIEFIFNSHGKNLKVPLLNKDLLYLLGCVYGDGDVSINNRQGVVRISNSNKLLLNSLANISKKQLGKDVKIELQKARVPVIRINSKVFANLVYKLGYRTPKNTMFIHPKLTAIPKEDLKFLIRGIFDTDGYVIKRTGHGGEYIGFSTISKDFATQVSLLLRRWGILSHISKKKRAGNINTIAGKTVIGQYEVTIYSQENLELFKKHIGFGINEKQEKFDLILKKYKHRTAKPPDKDLVFSTIKKISNVKDKWVYDFTIKDVHNFFANGFIAHNTASAVKDEFGEGGWTLKAGALVLASGGFAMIDEFDKMNPEDRSAMHEAMEQESYHKDFEIMFSDGSKEKIGDLVDSLINKNKSKVMKGIDCEILKVKDLSVITTNFKETFPIKVDRVSRHKAPNKFIEITYSNGRKITVTPNHPIFVLENNSFIEKPAESLKKGLFCPYTTLNNLEKTTVLLDNKNIVTSKKEITLPNTITPELGALLGYILTEGHCYLDKSNHYAEIGISNTDSKILSKMHDVFSKSFNVKLNINIQKPENRKNATKTLTTIRCCSLALYDFFEKNFGELVSKSTQKRIPKKLFACPEAIQNAFLSAAFEGDGFVDSGRFGFITASKLMAEDYQDLLLQLGIFSRIQTENRKEAKYYKIVITGFNSKNEFLKLVSKQDKRSSKIHKQIEKSSKISGQRELLPISILKQVNEIQKELKISKGYFVTPIRKGHNAEKKTILQALNKINKKLLLLKEKDFQSPRLFRTAFCIRLKTIAKEMNLSTSMITYIERNPNTKLYSTLNKKIREIGLNKINKIEKEISQIENIINSKMSLVIIKAVKTLQNHDSEWVYDVTVEPTRTFITGGLILHNTVSIAKAGIVSNFKTETSILAAANPKYGRFDQYKTVPEQIDIPPTLMSRFDLFFSIKDLLDEKRDKETVMSILKGHKTGELLSKMKQTDLAKKDRDYLEKSSKPQIHPDLLKKYISYARTKISPVLSDKAMDRLGKFFIDLRKKSKDGRVTVTYRQLEALIRLSEASARVRLGQTVEIEDAERAIKLFRTSMEQVGMDPETGDMDIDIIATGQSHSQAVQMRNLLETIKDWCKEHDSIKLNELMTEAEARKIDKLKIQDYVSKLLRAGDVYEPKPLHYKPVFKE